MAALAANAQAKRRCLEDIVYGIRGTNGGKFSTAKANMACKAMSGYINKPVSSRIDYSGPGQNCKSQFVLVEGIVRFIWGMYASALFAAFSKACYDVKGHHEAAKNDLLGESMRSSGVNVKRVKEMHSFQMGYHQGCAAVKAEKGSAKHKTKEIKKKVVSPAGQKAAGETVRKLINATRTGKQPRTKGFLERKSTKQEKMHEIAQKVKSPQWQNAARKAVRGLIDAEVAKTGKPHTGASHPNRKRKASTKRNTIVKKESLKGKTIVKKGTPKSKVDKQAVTSPATKRATKTVMTTGKNKKKKSVGNKQMAGHRSKAAVAPKASNVPPSHSGKPGPVKLGIPVVDDKKLPQKMKLWAKRLKKGDACHVPWFAGGQCSRDDGNCSQELLSFYGDNNVDNPMTLYTLLEIAKVFTKIALTAAKMFCVGPSYVNQGWVISRPQTQKEQFCCAEGAMIKWETMDTRGGFKAFPWSKGWQSSVIPKEIKEDCENKEGKFGPGKCQTEKDACSGRMKRNSKKCKEAQWMHNKVFLNSCDGLSGQYMRGCWTQTYFRRKGEARYQRWRGFTPWRAFKDTDTKFNGVNHKLGYWPKPMQIFKKVKELIKTGSGSSRRAGFSLGLSSLLYFWHIALGYPVAIIGCMCSNALAPAVKADRDISIDARYCEGDGDDCDKPDAKFMQNLTANEKFLHTKMHLDPQASYNSKKKPIVQAGPIGFIVTARYKEGPAKEFKGKTECKFLGLGTLKFCRCSPGKHALAVLPDSMNYAGKGFPTTCGCFDSSGQRKLLERDFNLKLLVDESWEKKGDKLVRSSGCKKLFGFVDTILRSVWTIGSGFAIYPAYQSKGTNKQGAISEKMSWIWTRENIWRAKPDPILANVRPRGPRHQRPFSLYPYGGRNVLYLRYNEYYKRFHKNWEKKFRIILRPARWSLPQPSEIFWVDGKPQKTRDEKVALTKAQTRHSEKHRKLYVKQLVHGRCTKKCTWYTKLGGEAKCCESHGDSLADASGVVKAAQYFDCPPDPDCKDGVYVSDNYTYRDGKWRKTDGKPYLIQRADGVNETQARDGKPVWVPGLDWKKEELYRFEGEKVFVRTPTPCVCSNQAQNIQEAKRRHQLQTDAKLCATVQGRKVCDHKFPWRALGFYTGKTAPDDGRVEDPRFPGNYDRAEVTKSNLDSSPMSRSFRLPGTPCLAPGMAASGPAVVRGTPLRPAPGAQIGPRGS